MGEEIDAAALDEFDRLREKLEADFTGLTRSSQDDAG
jgi:hypothetical protein